MSSASAPVAVVGAGIAGLTAANFLRRNGVPVVLLEGGKQIAGMASSYVDERGFHYDAGAHFITNRLAAAVGVSSQCRDVAYYGESFLLRGKAYSYPFGLLRVPRFVASALKGKVAGPFARRSVRNAPVGESLRGSHGPDNSRSQGSPSPANGDSRASAGDFAETCPRVPTAADWFRSEFGDALANEVSLPILEAWSGLPADQLSAAVGEKLQNSILRTLYLKLHSRLQGRAISIGYSHEMREGPHVWHVYPERGVSQVCERLLEGLENVIEMESPVEQIIVDGGRVVAIRAAGRVREVAAVVSTVPAPILPKLIAGSDLLEPLRNFTFRGMTFVCLCFEKRGILPDTVLWTAGAGLPFFRLTETPRSMPWLAPAGKTIITCDIGCQPGDETWTLDDETLARRCLDGLASLYPGLHAFYAGSRVLRTPIAYPIYRVDYEPARRRFAGGTGIDGLYSIGRNGEFAHILMEDIYWRTLRKMNELIVRLPRRYACATASLP
ncbi:MAG: FAD-dependent oxidoreductase [Pirellulales bacterium]|nr:FAD-dependent oxidoreductase [Pirellulales bacterium]